MLNQDKVDVLYNRLVEIIDKESIGYISREPFIVYENLIKDKADDKLCRCVLTALLSGIVDVIQSECCYTKDVADSLTKLFLALFSDENTARWRTKYEEGFSAFCEQEWEYNIQWDA